MSVYIRKIIVSVLFLFCSNFAFADFCFTSVKDLQSCKIEDLIATRKPMNSILKFVDNKKSIQNIILMADPRDMLQYVQPGSPAHEKVLEDIKNFVPTTTITVLFHLDGNYFAQQLGPQSNCAYFGEYRETEEVIEFDSQKLIGDCSDQEQKMSQFTLGKSTYRKINY
jgi:hypothetical protein